MPLSRHYHRTMTLPTKDIMQHVFNEVAKRLTSKNPDADNFLALMDELHTVEMHVDKRQWKKALKRVAEAHKLVAPRCLK